MAYIDLVNELTGTLPGLSPLLAEKYINRAYEKILTSKLWSFLLIDAAVVCPAQFTDGAFDITQYSTTITADADASAALLAQAQNTTQPGLTNMQIRFGAAAATSPAIGQVYNIVAVDDTDPTALVLTLDRMVMEATSATASYQCYRCYVTPPVSDFLAWQSWVDMVNAFPLRTNVTSSMFDLRDPQRQAQGLAYFVGYYAGAYTPNVITGAVSPNPNVEAGSNLYELWPHPVQGQTFYVRYRRRGTGFVLPTEVQPAVIPDELILARALGWHAYPFAQANVANFPSFKNANFPTLIRQAQAQYAGLLQDTKIQDDEAALQSVWSTGHGLRQGVRDFKGISDFPIDSNFMQSHLVRF